MLVFYPGDDTPVCTKQLNSYNDELDQFEALDAQVLGDLRAERRAATRSSAASTGFQFPLLADTDKAVAGLYGTLGPLGFPRRSVFVIDGGRHLATPTGRSPASTYRPVSELVEVLRAFDRAGS